jgi:hypothetical protein
MKKMKKIFTTPNTISATYNRATVLRPRREQGSAFEPLAMTLKGLIRHPANTLCDPAI